MSASAFSHLPAPLPARRPGSGPPGASAVTGAVPPYRLGNALRAVKVYVSTAFEVAVLGEYAEEAGVRRRVTTGDGSAGPGTPPVRPQAPR